MRLYVMPQFYKDYKYIYIYGHTDIYGHTVFRKQKTLAIPAGSWRIFPLTGLLFPVFRLFFEKNAIFFKKKFKKIWR